MPLIHTAAARRRAVLIAAAVGVVALVALVLVLWWLKTHQRTAPVDCVPAASWSAWSDCSAPCSVDGLGGWQYATRPPAVMPSNGGALCRAADLIQSRTCNSGVPCGVACIPDPNPDRYAWSGCPACVPQGLETVSAWRVVPPLQQAGPGGAACALADVFQTSVCSNIPLCDASVDCVVDTAHVVASTSCNAVCGSGVQYVWHSVSTAASGHGAGCDWNLLVQQVPCSGPPCPSTLSCTPSAQAWPSVWSECSTPSGSGWQYQTRAPSGPLDHCPLVRSQSCVGPLPSSGGDGTCAPPTWEYLDTLCYMACAGMPLPTASLTDGGLPFCAVPPSALAAVCGGGGQGNCLQPRDCSLTAWGPWGACSVPSCDADAPLGGVQTAVRSITAYEVGGGKPCADFPTVLTRPCNTLQAVNYASLSADGATLVPSVAPPTCHPVDCSLSSVWTAVSPCSAACGVGLQTFTRTLSVLPADGGSCDVAAGDYVQVAPCTASAQCGSCQFMDLDAYLASCTANDVNPWSTCSSECDGVMTLTLPITVPPPHGGWCSMSDAIRTRSCCSGCVCEDRCPLGTSNLPCSGNGVCTSVSDATVLGGWAYACTCADGYQGVACGDRCPLGSDGSPCGAASGLGTCGSDGLCTCTSGMSGAACSLGGVCVVTGSFTLLGDGGGPTPVTVSLAIPPETQMGYTDFAINQSSCAAAAVAVWGALHGIVNIQNWTFAALTPPSTLTWSVQPAMPPSLVHGLSDKAYTEINNTLESVYGRGGTMAWQYRIPPQLSPTQIQNARTTCSMPQLWQDGW